MKPVLNLTLLFLMFNFSCKHQQISCNETINDASELPMTSFMFIELDNYYRSTECLEKPCMPVVATINASGFIAMRSRANDSMGYVVTAHHFCEDRNAIAPDGHEKLGHQFHAYDYYGRKHDARYMVSNEESDVCILVINRVYDDIEIVKLGSTLPKLGSRVYTLSAPKGYFLPNSVLIFEGLYSGMSHNDMISTLPVEPGSSGSPIFNQDGLLIGMITGYPTLRIKVEDDNIKSERISGSISMATPLSGLISILNVVGEIDDIMVVTSTASKRLTR